MSLVLAEKGEIEEAEQLLKSVANEKRSGKFYSALGHVKLERLFQVFMSSPILAMFCEGVVVLPLFDNSKTWSSVQKKTNGVGKAARQILAILIDAFNYHVKFGSSHELGMVGIDIAATLFSMAYVVDGDVDAGEVGYYLEMSKGFTWRHEKAKRCDTEKEIVWPGEVGICEVDGGIEGFRRDIDMLPAELVVCSLSVDVARNHIYISRYQRNREPEIIRLGLLRDEDNILRFKDALDEFNEIIEESNESMANSESYNERKGEWWSKRRVLDKRLQKLLGRIESCWFGGFKGVFSTVDIDDVSEFRNEIEGVLKTAMGGKRGVSLNEAFCRGLLRLGKSVTSKEVADWLGMVLDCNRYSGNLDFEIDDVCLFHNC